MKIILVDDDSVQRTLFKHYFSEFSIQVYVFSNPLEALAFLDKSDTNFDFIFSDYRMREMTGIEFLKEISLISKKSHMILISGSPVDIISYDFIDLFLLKGRFTMKSILTLIDSKR